MSAVVYPRYPPRRGQVRASSWWGRAWVRALEEAAYSDADLRSARSHARHGAVGQITIDLGSAVAAVNEGEDLWPVRLSCEQLSSGDRSLFVELVAAEAGRVAGLLGGELPHALVEDGEESGLELLPYSGDLSSACTCAAWVDPCPHALALGYQVGWLLEGDPFVLLHLRGVPREELLSRAHRLAPRPPGAVDDVQVGQRVEDDADLIAGAEAADRAGRALALIAEGKPFEHLF